jgi:hypothetical protein
MEFISCGSPTRTSEQHLLVWRVHTYQLVFLFHVLLRNQHDSDRDALNQGFLHVTAGKGDAILLPSVRVRFRVQDSRVEALGILPLLYEDRSHCFRSHIARAVRIKCSTGTVSRQHL